MSTNEMDRFFTLLQNQGDELKRQGNLLATIAQEQKDTKERLFGGTNPNDPGAIPYLFTEVTKHGKQIVFWRGAFAVVGFLWTAAVAFVGRRH